MVKELLQIILLWEERWQGGTIRLCVKMQAMGGIPRSGRSKVTDKDPLLHSDEKQLIICEHIRGREEVAANACQEMILTFSGPRFYQPWKAKWRFLTNNCKLSV